MLKLVIFTVCSSSVEQSRVKQSLNNLRIGNNCLFVVVNNFRIPFRRDECLSNRIVIHENGCQLNLNQSIGQVFRLLNSSYYIRIDPDDINYNVDILWDELPLSRQFDLLTCHYSLDYGDHKLPQSLSAELMGSIYEPLGAGVVISRRLLYQSLMISKGLAGQDNYALWLALYILENGCLLAGSHKYIYKLDEIGRAHV